MVSYLSLLAFYTCTFSVFVCQIHTVHVHIYLTLETTKGSRDGELSSLVSALSMCAFLFYGSFIWSVYIRVYLAVGIIYEVKVLEYTRFNIYFRLQHFWNKFISRIKKGRHAIQTTFPRLPHNQTVPSTLNSLEMELINMFLFSL